MLIFAFFFASPNFYLPFGNCVFSLLFSATMSLLDNRGTVRHWAPPGWHWEVLPSETHSLVRNPGDVVDPDLVWWKSHGPRSVQREPAPDAVVRRRIREEEEHVRRYMYLLERQYSNTWQVLQRDPPHSSYVPLMVPALWVCCAPRSAPRGLGPVVVRVFESMRSILFGVY